MTYSSSVSASRRQYARRHQNTVTFKATARTLGPVSNSVVLMVLACLIGLLYLAQVTKTSSLGYTINGLSEKKSELTSEKAGLEVTAARLQSLDRVAASEAAKKLVSVAPSGTISTR